MSRLDPSVARPRVLAEAGYLRAARLYLDPALFGVPQLDVLLDAASFQDAGNPVFTQYALMPPSGPKQQGLHSRGTAEYSISLSGVLSASGWELTGLLKPEARGRRIGGLLLQQGATLARRFSGLWWSKFSLQAAENSPVKFSCELRATAEPEDVAPVPVHVAHVPIPSWATGAELATQWSLSHTVPLTPVWRNTPFKLPAYYRPGDSQFDLSITTATALREHDTIEVAVGRFAVAEAVVTSRSWRLGGRTDAATYDVQVRNVRYATEIRGDTFQLPYVPTPSEEREAADAARGGSFEYGTYAIPGSGLSMSQDFVGATNPPVGGTPGHLDRTFAQDATRPVADALTGGLVFEIPLVAFPDAAPNEG